MSAKNQRNRCLLAAAAAAAISSSTAWGTVSPNYQNNPTSYTNFDPILNTAVASGGDLILQGSSTLGSVSAPSASAFGFGAVGIYDGNTTASAANSSYYTVGNGGAGQLPVDYIFTFANSSSGYDINTILSDAGWSSSNLASQDFDVYVQTITNPTFVQVGGDFLNATSSGGTANSTLTTITDTTGLVASGVTAIEFQLIGNSSVFPNQQGGLGGTVYHEMAVLGSATPLFDANTTTAGAQDGSGVWNTTTANFYNGSSDSVWSNSANGTAEFGNGGTAGIVTVGTVMAGAIAFNSVSSGNYNLTGGTITLGSAAPAILTTSDATIGSAINSANGLYKTGNGNLTLTGASNLGSLNTFVQTGTLTVAGAGSITSTALLGVGANPNTLATMNITTSGTITYTNSGDNCVGFQSNAVGSVNQSSGTVQFSGNLALGLGSATASGTYNLNGNGILTVSETNPGLVVSWGGPSTFIQSGASTLNVPGYLYVGVNSVGVMTFVGGTVNQSTAGAWSINIGYGGSGSGTINVGTEAGGNAFVNNSNGGINLGDGSGNTGVINLNSGTLEMAAYGMVNNAASASNLNLNGGTLKVGSSALASFVSPGQAPTLKVFSGGLIADTNGFNTAVGASLMGASGSGVYEPGGTIATGGFSSGIVGAPVVTVTGGSGSGISAIADVVNGSVTGFTITNPGENYVAGDTLTFSMAGANATAATFTHTLTTAEVSSNVGTSLTKLGVGKLTLGNSNTYLGTTIISAGTLALQVNNAISSSSPIVMSGTSTLYTGGYSQNLGTLTIGGANTIDFGAGGGSGIVQFAASNLQSWSGSLTVADWTGTPTSGGGSEQLLFGSNTSGLTATQLSDIHFTGYASGATILNNGEVVPLTSTRSTVTHVTSGTPTVMALGDSITYGQSGNEGGNSYPGGYRDPMYGSLHSAGFVYNAVGSENGNSTAQLTAANESLQEGHSGFRIDQITSNIDSWMSSTNRASTVLLMIGTNDVTQQFDSNPSGNGFAADAASRLMTLISDIYSDSPNATVYVSSIIPILSTDNYPASRWSPDIAASEVAYNSLIESEVVPAFQATGESIYFVDNYSAFLNPDGSVNLADYGTDDDEHPSAAGYAVMGQVWANALLQTTIFQNTGVGQTAIFGNTINAGPTTVTITQNQTAGTFAFNASAGVSFTLNANAGDVLTLDNNGVAANITVNAGTHALNLPIVLADGVNVNIASGVNLGGPVTGTGPFTLTTGALTVTTNGSIGVPVITSGNLTFANNSSGAFTVQTLPSLNITGGKVTVATAPNLASRQVLSIGGLSFGGTTGSWTGQLDLTNNSLVVQGGNLKIVTNQVAEGYNGGTWNGPDGIISSTAAGDSNHLTALGVIANDNGMGQLLYGTNGSITGTFDGATPSDGDILVKYTFYGDTDLNGTVDGTDYGRIDAAYLSEQGVGAHPATGWFNGDFNYDGVVDGSDYTLMDNAFNNQGASLESQVIAQATPTAQIIGAGATSAVPEPASLGLLALGAIGMLGRRRRAPR